MKKNMLFIGAAFISISLFGQTPKLPAGKPGQVPAVAPKLQALKPADLSVTGLELVSAEKNNSTKTVLVKVKVTIKNNGQLEAPASKVGAALQKTTQTSGWTNFENNIDIEAVKPGQSVTKECTFKILIGLINANNFRFRVKADVSGQVSESDETNNFSQGILIAL